VYLQLWVNDNARRNLEICQKYYAFARRGVHDVLYRSNELAFFAQRILPESCHTPFTANTARAFSQYVAEKVRLSKDCEPTRHVQFCSCDPMTLLLVNWRDSLFDGAASPLTYGFIDDNWIPGWDTWLAIVSLEGKPNDHALLCWVPVELCREVDSAITVDAARSLSWLAFDHAIKPFLVGWGKRWTPS
jgi:hypothetical protein